MEREIKQDERDELPVMMVVTPDEYLVVAGEPETVMSRKKEITEYMAKGYTIKTVKFKEYNAMNLKWIWEKR